MPEVHDLAVSKYAAGHEKDREFTSALARHGMVSPEVLRERLEQTHLDPWLRDIILRRIDADFADANE